MIGQPGVWATLDTATRDRGPVTAAQTLAPNVVISERWQRSFQGYFGLIFVERKEVDMLPPSLGQCKAHKSVSLAQKKMKL